MKRIIRHIRRQPEETKRHILHLLTFLAGVILIFLWIYSLGTSLTSEDTQVKISQDLEPLSALKDNMVDGYKSIANPEQEQTQ